MPRYGQSVRRNGWKPPERHEIERIWVAIARNLRLQGWSYQRIGDHLFPERTKLSRYRKVYVALNPDRVKRWNAKAPSTRKASMAEKKRRQRQRLAPDCTLCGKPMSRPPTVLPPICVTCRRQRNIDFAWYRIKELWNSDVPTAEIAREVGRSEKAIHAAISRMRQKGWDIKGRQPVGPPKRAPEVLA